MNKRIKISKYKPSVSKIRGYTLIELLIVITIFAILSFITMQALGRTLRGSRKSENVVKTKENVDFAVSTMERLLRNASNTRCSNGNLTLSYYDENNTPVSFDCLPHGSTSGYIASGSARLTSNEVRIDCSGAVFQCTAASANTPPSVKITVKGKRTGAEASDESLTTSVTTVLLRTYISH